MMDESSRELVEGFPIFHMPADMHQEADGSTEDDEQEEQVKNDTEKQDVHFHSISIAGFVVDNTALLYVVTGFFKEVSEEFLAPFVTILEWQASIVKVSCKCVDIFFP